MMPSQPNAVYADERLKTVREILEQRLSVNEALEWLVEYIKVWPAEHIWSELSEQVYADPEAVLEGLIHVE